jgi:tetratricopeptide (TPR) repeat protein
MATGPLSIKLRCASWQQLATIYKRDLSRGSMFLKATTPPAIGTTVRIDLTLPSASVIVLTGTVDQHVTDEQRGAGVELKLAPIAPAQIYMIESALASEAKRRNTPAAGVPIVIQPQVQTGPHASIAEGEEVGAAEHELVSALLAEADSLRKLNPFLVLGVGYEAGDADVRAAFGELTKRYHPDLFARYESRELRETAAEIFILIRDAYRKLGDEAGRAQALAALGRAAAPRAVPLRPGTPPPVPRPPPLPPQRGSSQAIPKVPEVKPPERAPELPPPPPPPARPATDFANTARTSFDAATSRPAEPPKIPAAAKPTEPPPRAASMPIPRVTPEPPRGSPNVTVPMAQGQAFPQTKVSSSSSMKPALGTEPPPVVDGSDANHLDELLDAGKFDEALAAYRVLAKKQPQDRTFRAGVELCEGLKSLAARDRLEAAQRFEAALEIDPSNERAARELADMRRQATNERKGLLTRLMGKKEP